MPVVQGPSAAAEQFAKFSSSQGSQVLKFWFLETKPKIESWKVSGAGVVQWSAVLCWVRIFHTAVYTLLVLE